MKILVTGGNGFLGLEICKQLKTEGHIVLSMSRSHSETLKKMDIEQIQCDISNKLDVDHKFPVVDAVFHTAALAGIWGRPEIYRKINIEGTINIVDAAKSNKVRYFIHTSSPSAVIGKYDLSGVDETIHYPPKFYTAYAETKCESEKYVLSQNSKDILTLSFRPHLIWGKGDPHILPRLVDRANKKKLLIIGNGKNKVDVVHVKNAAFSQLCGLNSLIKNPTLTGNVYFVGQNEPVILWDFINKLLATQNISAITKKIPFGLAFNLGIISESIFQLLRIYDRDPPMTRFLALQMGKDHYFSHEKLKKELNYHELISTEDGLKDLKF